MEAVNFVITNETLFNLSNLKVVAFKFDENLMIVREPLNKAKFGIFHAHTGMVVRGGYDYKEQAKASAQRLSSLLDFSVSSREEFFEKNKHVPFEKILKAMGGYHV